MADWSEEDLQLLRSTITPEERSAARQQAPQQVEAQAAQPASSVEQVNDFPGAVGLLGKQAYGGAESSLKRTYLGLKQLATYLTGDERARQAVNDEISRMEQEYGPILDTPAGAIGNVAGTVAQFLAPGVAAKVAGKALPGMARVIQKITGIPGSIQRASATSGAFEAVQPVTPGNTSTDEYALQKAIRIAEGSGIGAATGAIANKAFRGGVEVPPERSALVSTAQQLGMPLTPAQKTADPGMWSAEKRFGIQSGSQPRLLAMREAQHDIVDELAAKALGAPAGKRMTSSTLLDAAKQANAKYATLAKVGVFPTAATARKKALTDTLDSIVDLEPDVEKQAKRITKHLDTFDGQRFISELQRLRNDISGAFEQGSAGRNKAEALSSIEQAFHKYGEESVDHLAKMGQVPADAVQQMIQGRQDWSLIHHLQKAYSQDIKSPLTPNKQGINIATYLRKEAERRPPTRQYGSSPLDVRLADLNMAAETWRGIQPPPDIAKTSSTPEGLYALGGNRLARLLRLTDVGNKYLTMREGTNFDAYLRNAEPNALGRVLGPQASMSIRRMLPPAAVGAFDEEAR